MSKELSEDTVVVLVALSSLCTGVVGGAIGRIVFGDAA